MAAVAMFILEALALLLLCKSEEQFEEPDFELAAGCVRRSLNAPRRADAFDRV